MNKFEDTDDTPGGNGEAGEPEPSSVSAFDPLFDPWEARSTDGEAGTYDALFLTDTPDPSAEIEYPTRDAAPVASRTGTAFRYPDDHVGTYEQRLTELQRRLKAETVTIPRPRRRWSVTVREIAETLALAILIFLAVRGSFQNFRVEGASMHPSLENGEYLIVNKLSYARVDLSVLNWVPFFDAGEDPIKHLWGEPSRGDVVVFTAPTSVQRDFIKRIIGVPGDTIEIDDQEGTVLVNGVPLDEPYAQGRTHCGGTCVFELPEANTPQARASCGSNSCYFVMGDNRQNSSDSRQGWFVPLENIVGKALLTYWHEGGPELRFAPNHSIGVASDAAVEEDE